VVRDKRTSSRPLHQPQSIDIEFNMPSSNIMNREALLAEKHVEILATPLLAIRGHLCFRCWMPHAGLKKCAGCRRVAYCGDQCQKIDWKAQHKKDCKKLRTVNQIEALETAPQRTAALWKSSLVCAKDALY
jgi:splicing suppressor protein 51